MVNVQVYIPYIEYLGIGVENAYISIVGIYLYILYCVDSMSCTSTKQRFQTIAHFHPLGSEISTLSGCGKFRRWGCTSYSTRWASTSYNGVITPINGLINELLGL